MRTLPFLVLPFVLAGCPLPEDKDTADTADTGDSGDTGTSSLPDPWSWSDDDATCDGWWDEAAIPDYDEAGGCGWGFVYGETPAEAFQLRLTLPREDMLTAADIAYDLTLGADAELVVLDRSGGTDAMDYWSCSDYMEGFEGTSWTATSGIVRVEARYLCDTTNPCGATTHEYHTMVYLRDVTLRAADGTEMSWPDQDFRVSFGWSDCGG